VCVGVCGAHIWVRCNLFAVVSVAVVVLGRAVVLAAVLRGSNQSINQSSFARQQAEELYIADCDPPSFSNALSPPQQVL
jgi:hypothetical protein